MEPDLIQNSITQNCYEDYDYGPQFKKLRITDNVRELQTVLRDRGTSRGDFIFYADRLIRLVVEEGLNQLPYKHCEIVTPTGQPYDGLRYEKGNCGVSIMRSDDTNFHISGNNDSHDIDSAVKSQDITIDRRGEAMEQGLRDCCRSIRIGKILVQSDEDTHEAKVVYAKLPPDISYRKVLLMYPIMSTGNTVIKAVNVLKEHKVREDNIILLNLFVTPSAAKTLVNTFPEMTVLTSEVHPVAPNHFGQKYFGTE